MTWALIALAKRTILLDNIFWGHSIYEMYSSDLLVSK
jgi:hypothetical protein